MARTNQTARKGLQRARKAPKFTGKGGKTGAKLPVNTSGVKKAHRYRSGTVALRDIRKYQKTTENLIPRLPFQRLVREIAQDYDTNVMFERTALFALQDIIERHIINMLIDGNLISIHTKRVTLMSRDIDLGNNIATRATLF